MYQLGAMVGPALGGTAMQRLGPDALALTLAIVLMVFVAGSACGLFFGRPRQARA
jgi:predicted MFS family arabinose efflux permease